MKAAFVGRTVRRDDRTGASPSEANKLGEGRRPSSIPVPGVGQLTHALRHSNPDVRAAAAHRLGEIDPTDAEAPAVVSALVQSLSDSDPSVRSSAGLSLGAWGAAAVDAVPALIAALADEDDDVRSSAGIALQDIGRAARQPLTEALSHPDARVRAEAEAILVLMGDGTSSGEGGR